MKPKFYFKHAHSDICYTEDYFKNEMKQEGLTEMAVFEAIKDKIKGVFWCKHEQLCGDDSTDTCGKQCDTYAPRNGKSGCCRHYTTVLYIHGNQVTLKLQS